jgi:hypothetical protein
MKCIPLTFYPEGVAKASQIFLRDAHVSLKLLAMRNTADVTDGKPSQLLMLLVTVFHGRQREVLFLYFVPHTIY